MAEYFNIQTVWCFQGGKQRRIIIQRNQPQPPPIYIIQADDDSDSDHEYSRCCYGDNVHRHPVFPHLTHNGIPYQHQPLLPQIQPAHSQQVAPDERGYNRMQVKLEYGCIVSGMGRITLPDAVQEEVMKEYGHIKNTEVVIVRNNGNYSIHSTTSRTL